jgi:hypothetical protein
MSQINNAAIAARTKKEGTWSVKGEKIRVLYSDSEESVLFEDTSSIGYLKCSKPNEKYIILGYTISISCTIYYFMNPEMFELFYGIFGAFILGLILGYMNKIHFDNVSIETRGGKIIHFSVEQGQGSNIMDQIEDEKSKWEESK